jgi:hypothetical protein
MAEIKTKATTLSVKDFLEQIEPEDKKKDGLALLEIFESVTGEKGVMWGASIVGFGKYHYKSEKSRQEADWPKVGFSPRKANLTLYIIAGNDDNKDLFEKLGKHKSSVGCLYINKLADVDIEILKKLIESSYRLKRE